MSVLLAGETGVTAFRRATAPPLTWEMKHGSRFGAARRFTPERWLPVPGWAAYEASGLGRVRSVDRVTRDGQLRGGQILKPSPDEGYLYVTLRDGKRRRRVGVHRLVLLAHAGEPGPGQEALHRNGTRDDNRLANLRWGTKPENRADRETHRRHSGLNVSSGLNGYRKTRAGLETGITPCAVTAVSRFTPFRGAA